MPCLVVELRHAVHVRVDVGQHTLFARRMAIGVRQVQRLGMRVEFEKGVERALALRIAAWTYCEIAPKLGRRTMATKLSQPVKNSTAKRKAKGSRKVMAGC